MRRLALTALAAAALVGAAPARLPSCLGDCAAVAVRTLPEGLPFRQRARLMLRWGLACHEAGDAVNARALVSLAFMQDGACRARTAREALAWQRAFPWNEHIRNDAAWGLLLSGGDPRAALALLRGCRRWDAATFDTLAVAQWRSGFPAEGLQTLLRAFEVGLGEHGPIAFDHLGDLLYANGFREDALRAWGRARALHRYFLGAGGDPDEALLRDYDDAATRRKRMAVKWLLREAPSPPPPAPGAPRGKLRQGKENA